MEVKPERAVSTGITFEAVLPECVPLFEEELIRISLRYSIPEWESLGYWDRVREVAVYRLNKLKEFIENDRLQDYIESKAKK